MNYFLLFQAFAIGFLVASAIGPIALLCLGKTIREGFLMGIAAGFGVACADAVYAAVALGGVAALAHFLLGYKMYVQLVVAVYLVYLGSTIAFQEELPDNVSFIKTSYTHSLITTFFLTLANPTTILGFVTLFAGFNMIAQTPFGAMMIIGGVFMGSLSWWIILAGIGHLMSRTVNRKLLYILHKVSGYIIASVGGIALIDALWTLAKITLF